MGVSDKLSPDIVPQNKVSLIVGNSHIWNRSGQAEASPGQVASQAHEPRAFASSLRPVVARNRAPPKYFRSRGTRRARARACRSTLRMRSVALAGPEMIAGDRPEPTALHKFADRRARMREETMDSLELSLLPPLLCTLVNAGDTCSCRVSWCRKRSSAGQHLEQENTCMASNAAGMKLGNGRRSQTELLQHDSIFTTTGAVIQTLQKKNFAIRRTCGPDVDFVVVRLVLHLGILQQRSGRRCTSHTGQ